MIKILLLSFLCICSFTSCKSDLSKPEQQVQKQTSKEAKADFKTIEAFIYEKLEGQTLIRNYGKDSGQTKIIFKKDGNFIGDYLGKIKADGFDGGLSDKAAIYYHAEEIHTSNFEGRFKLKKMINDHTFLMELENLKFTSETGPYNDIYYKVDFALGLEAFDEFYLYTPGTELNLLDKNNAKLMANVKKTESDEKTTGFVIYNKSKDDIFNQLH